METSIKISIEVKNENIKNFVISKDTKITLNYEGKKK